MNQEPPPPLELPALANRCADEPTAVLAGMTTEQLTALIGPSAQLPGQANASPDDAYEDPAELTSARVVSGLVVDLEFGAGATRRIDLAPLMRGEVFDRVRAAGQEQAFTIDLGTLTWPGGADICADVLAGAPTVS